MRRHAIGHGTELEEIATCRFRMKSSTLHVNGCDVGRSASVHVEVRRGLHEFGFHHRNADRLRLLRTRLRRDRPVVVMGFDISHRLKDDAIIRQHGSELTGTRRNLVRRLPPAAPSGALSELQWPHRRLPFRVRRRLQHHRRCQCLLCPLRRKLN